MSYLIEFRRRLIRGLFAILIIFFPLCYFAKDLYTLLALPMLNHLPDGSYLIATNIAAPFLAPFKFALIVAVLLTMPYLLQQCWSFIAPALYRKERYFYLSLLVVSIVLFYAGILFAYFTVFPLIFRFFINMAPNGIKVLPDMTHYLDFTLTLLFVFGLAFEVPVLTVIMIKSGICTMRSLKNKRPYVIVGAFIIGMLLTPPDIISQTLLAVPIWLLFEIGLFIAKCLQYLDTATPQSLD